MFSTLFRRLTFASVMAMVGILLLSFSAFAANAQQLGSAHAASGYFFTTLDDQADPTFNQLLGLNDKGIAVGFYTDANGVNHAYKLNQKTGKFTELTVPNATSAIATGINNNGDISGFLMASNGDTVAFLLKGSTYTEFDFPGSTNTQALGINKYDQIVGSYVDGNGLMHGFLLSSPLHNAKWQSIDDPNGIGTTVVNGLNDNAQLVGFYVDGAGNTDGFLATK